jgi:hypothetical protein
MLVEKMLFEPGCAWRNNGGKSRHGTILLDGMAPFIFMSIGSSVAKIRHAFRAIARAHIRLF